MKIKTRALIRLAVIAACMMLVGVAIPAGAVDTNNKADLILGSGSDTTIDVMRSLDTAFNASHGCKTESIPGNPQPLDFSCAQTDTIVSENYDHDVAVSYYPLGSSNGVKQLCETGLAGVAHVDYARSSRGPKGSDCAGVRFVAFARDGIPWVGFPNTPGSLSAGVANLSQAQIRGIFSLCTIRDWRQVPGSPAYDSGYVLPGVYDYSDPLNVPIFVYAAQSGSGTRSSFDSFIGGSSQACIPSDKLAERVIFENNAQPIVNNGEQKNAIFYYSFGRYAINGGETSVLGAIDGVTPTTTTLGDGSFPYNRYVYNVYRATTSPPTATSATVAYVGEADGWICKSDAQHSINPATGVNYGVEVANVIANNGFVPLPEGAIGGGVSGTSKCRVV